MCFRYRTHVVLWRAFVVVLAGGLQWHFGLRVCWLEFPVAGVVWTFGMIVATIELLGALTQRLVVDEKGVTYIGWYPRAIWGRRFIPWDEVTEVLALDTGRKVVPALLLHTHGRIRWHVLRYLGRPDALLQEITKYVPGEKIRGRDAQAAAP